MKKFVIITLIFAMAAGAAFAQTADGISINAWGRGAFSPLKIVGKEKSYGESKNKTWVDVGGDGKWYLDEDEGPKQHDPENWVEVDNRAKVYTGAGVTWGDMTRADFRINGNAEFVGFGIQITEDGIDGGDFRYIWVKPFSNDFVKLNVGKYVDDTLRGKIGNLDGGFSNFVLATSEEDAIFTRLETNAGERRFWATHDFGWGGNSQGFMLSSAPMDGLFLAVNVISPFGWAEDWQAADIYRFIQIGAGYEIADIGHFRAQYVGGWLGTITNDKEKDLAEKGYKGVNAGLPARIEAAFALTAIDNLLVDLGFKFWLPVEYTDKKQKISQGINASVGAQFRMEAFSIAARVDTGFGAYDRTDWTDGTAAKSYKDSKKIGPLSLQAHLVPSYDLDAFTIGASLGLKMTGNGFDDKGEGPEKDYAKTNSAQFGFGGFVSKSLGSGSVKAGLAYTTAPFKNGYKLNDNNEPVAQKGFTGSGVFTIPIILEYAFF
jgi:hypothetical protein